MRASLSAHDLFRRALGDNLATTVPALRTHVYDPVRLRDDIEIVLNDDDRVPASTNRCRTLISFSTSAMCNPMVGSSSTYSVWRAVRCKRSKRGRAFDSSATNLILCASPPESVGLCCPSVR
ncbi:MAG: hypothetical protein CM1200mP36_09280 [Gammaproteobacteria bacterium]|nr:MAG: hypothetical protein CM1200mP36_09280 [Gammaproteobacteria bacterium]